MPIGRPLPNTTLYILDDALRPGASGVVGELFVGGAGVGRGYVGQPSMTADRFVPDAFGAAGGRLYRTGDLARWLPDGSVDMIGRADDQVKIRGYRIEPGEIRAVLLELAAVRDAVVVADGGRLTGYVVPADGTAVDAAAIADHCADHCAARLPEYMVPTNFQLLESIPLNQNGKVDRRRLPRLDEPSTSVENRPRTPVEQRICRDLDRVAR